MNGHGIRDETGREPARWLRRHSRTLVLALALVIAILLNASTSASAAIVVYKPPATACLTHRSVVLDLGMSLNESWKESAAVRGRIAVTTSTGRRIVVLGTFATGKLTLTYHVRSPGRYRVDYEWFIPAGYLADQTLRSDLTRSAYHTGKWQTAATFVTRASACA